jgi:DNA mismatch repair protein PMS2
MQRLTDHRKKTVAFSTNSNPSTKENISNVYGAKTISALIPLHLQYEMDPSSRPGVTQSARTRSAQEDSGSRTIKIVGHISRPVVGEGRQTPDRQMFFVNSRPCNLPQVAKAINEVYKSYNVTQSPFVFADIQLDTNAYDVNVSPDKRTIMLHDQSALLESLKENLSKLFEEHHQSVPHAQVPLQKTGMAALKTPTLVPRASTDSAMADECSDAEELATVHKAHVDETNMPCSPDTLSAATLPGFTKASLIERFAGRNAEDRVTRPFARRRRNSSLENTETTKKRILNPASRQQSASPEQEQGHTAVLAHQSSQSPLFERENDVSPVSSRSAQTSRVVQDFNARMASPHARNLGLERTFKSPEPTTAATEQAEDPIPSIKQTPQKSLAQSTIQNAFDRMRPVRTPTQQATITIGDTTTVSTIGSGRQYTSSKRARIHIPKFSLTGTPLNQDPKQSRFVKSLRGFAAPGTQAESSEEEIEVDQDSSISNAPRRSLSPHQRPSSRSFGELRTGGIAILSSAPPPSQQTAEEGVTDDELPHETETEANRTAIEPDDDYIDEDEKQRRDEAMIEGLIAEAEEATANPTEANLKRANKLFKVSQNKYQTLNLERVISTRVDSIADHLRSLESLLDASESNVDEMALPTDRQLNKEDPEERLSLTVTKPDFNEMRIIGQFNLGFIIAVRPPTTTSPTSDLFIIDQHASDEKYNFERLSATTTLVSQRLVHPHSLELTAVEEELILANEHALIANGFIVTMDTSDDINSGQRAKLTSLPMSKEVTFTPTDLEELLALIFDNPSSSYSSTSPHIPRPSKVRKLLASRACRSSVMIGKTLKTARMREIVRHMGSMDKPWSCPHGRPTMRHLYGLENWQRWSEGDGVIGVDEPGKRTNWSAYLRTRQS